MATYLYCLLPAASERPPATLTGIADEPVRRVDAGGIAAWVGTIEGDVARSVETARRHDVVIRAALSTGVTPLPARGGQRFADDAACAVEVARRERAIVEALGRVAGCVEMSLHIVVAGLRSGHPEERRDERSPGVEIPRFARDDRAARAGPGREYLERLRAMRAMERGVQDELDGARARMAAGGAIIRGEVSRTDMDAGSFVVSHLVPREAVPRYRDAFRAMAGTGRLAAVRVGGPYAPYSFSEIEHE